MEQIQFLIDLFLHLDEHLANIINQYGVWTYAILFLIIFMETGFVVTPFLPGDSLLFVAGLLADSEYLDIHVSLLIVLLVIAAVSGFLVGYLTGKWAGFYLLNRKDSFFFKKKYIDVTQAFYFHGLSSHAN